MSSKTKGRRPFSWRRLNSALHRDFGYLAVGLTIVYAVSGFAVNHAHQWNASYSTTFEQRQLQSDLRGPVLDAAQRVVDELGLSGNWTAFHQDQGEVIYVGFKDRILTIRARVATGDALIESKQPRWLLREMNQLHLNEPRGLWTYIADSYALLLLALAGTGIFILRGRNGLMGRGKWFVIAGVLIPLVGFVVWRAG